MTIKSIRTGWTGISALAGNPVIGDFESIQTVTVGSGGAADIEFASIPSIYQHLQIRVIARSATASTDDFLNLRVNGDNTQSNYARHLLYGDGANAFSAASTGSTITNLGAISGANATSGIFGTFVIDILDYANTNKNKTIRSLGGFDRNGAGEVDFNSILWMNTNAISSVRLRTFTTANLAQHSTFALYGIR